jgi:hypothetical protein
MPFMNDQHIARLEAKLERLVEGTFSQLFGKRIHAQDIAIQLARAMEDGALTGQPGDPRPLAPDYYVIRLNPTVCAHLLQQQPVLPQRLSEHMIELATEVGYRLSNMPTVEIVPDEQLGVGVLAVDAQHVQKKHNTTAVMKRVDLPLTQDAPRNPQLLMHGQFAVPLNREMVNIGRSRDNHIVVDDPSVSRHHLQIRLRFGRYVLFDTHSQGGTTVNDVLVKEHTLQAGDVICMGRTRLVYMEDSTLGDTQTDLHDPTDSESAE